MPLDSRSAVHGGPATCAPECVPGRALLRPHARILICRPNSRLGNAVLLTPLVAEIAATLPHTRVDVLTAYPRAAELFSGFSCVGTVHALPYHGARHPLEHLRTLLGTWATRYDAVIDPCPWSWTSRFVTRRLRAGLKIGFTSPNKARGMHLSLPIEGAPQHMGVFPVYLFRRTVLGLEDADARAPAPRLTIQLTATEREEGRGRLRQLAPGPGPLIAVGGVATGAKQLEADWWRAMFEHLTDRLPRAQIIEIRPPSGKASFPEHPGYASAHVRQVASVIRAADCFVCADSGLMHLGSASLAATVGLFKVTDPKVYTPYGGASLAVTVGRDGPAAVAAEVARVAALAHR